MAMMKTTSSGVSVGLMLGAITVGLTGCGKKIIDEHCVFHGGDAGCQDGEYCVVVIGGGVVSGARNGCVLPEEDPQMLDVDPHLHLRYGLPRGATAADGIAEADTVLAILEQRLAVTGLVPVCPLGSMLPTEIGELEALDTVFAARGRLEALRKERRIRDEHAWLEQEEADAVRALYDAIDGWVLACEMMTGGTSTGTTEGTSSGSNSGSTTDGPCESHEDCVDPGAPFCALSGECVGSCGELIDGDAACAQLDPTRPACDGDACVECTESTYAACTGASLVCDTDTNTCVPCTEHSQCGEAACELAVGLCFPADAVVHVGPGQEYTTISSAVTSFGESAGTIIIHDGTTYSDDINISASMKLAFLAAENANPVWNNSYHITLNGGIAYVDGLRLSNGSYGARVYDGGFLWIDRSEIVQNYVGIEASNSAALTMRNCFAAHLVGAGYNAVILDSGSSATIDYSMLLGDAGFGESLQCSAPDSAMIRNSIVVTYDGNPINCPTATLDHCATTGNYGTTNVDVGPASTSWFEDFTMGDYHIRPINADLFAGIALWQIGDPTTDIDGDPRPTVDGTLDYAGADVP